MRLCAEGRLPPAPAAVGERGKSIVFGDPDLEVVRQQAQALLKAVGTFRISREAASLPPAAGRSLAVASARSPAVRGGPSDDWEQF